MAERRKRGLGRGLGALIPDAASSDRPVDVFFSGGEAEEADHSTEEPKAPRAARTDPAASMQSSRRRKPKDGSASGPSTEKTSRRDAGASELSSSKSAAVKSATAKTGSTKKAAATTSPKTGASQAASKKAAAGAKSAGTEAAVATPAADQSATTVSKATTNRATTNPKKSSGSKSTSGASAGAKSPETKTPARRSSTKATSDAAASSGPTAASAQDRTAPDSDSASSSAGVEVTPDPELNNTDLVETRVVETAEPDVEANFGDVTAGGRDEDSIHDDDVSETHPGVYRSGHEVFDGAPSEPANQTSKTTDEVDTTSKSSTTSSEPATAGEDDHSPSREDTDRAGVDSIPDTEFGEIDVDRIDANPRQPRTFFDEDQLSELVHSIREIGVLQPVVVRQKPSDSERFELIMGERRLRATKDAGLSTIPAIIRYVDDTDLLRDALLENLHRAELNPLEEAAAYGQLLEDFGCTQEELSERIGRSRPQISNTLRLLRLPPLVQRRVAAGVISAGHARAILGLREPEHMEVLAQRIVAEGLSVRASEEAVVLLNRGDSMNVSRATTRVAPQFVEVAERLGDRLDTKVNITVGKKKGKLSVEFANQNDLDRILSLLGVDAPTE